MHREHNKKRGGESMQTEMAEFPLSIPVDLKDFITIRAKQRGIPRNALISNLLWEYKEKTENEQKNR